MKVFEVHLSCCFDVMLDLLWPLCMSQASRLVIECVILDITREKTLGPNHKAKSLEAVLSEFLTYCSQMHLCVFISILRASN